MICEPTRVAVGKGFTLTFTGEDESVQPLISVITALKECDPGTDGKLINVAPEPNGTELSNHEYVKGCKITGSKM